MATNSATIERPRAIPLDDPRRFTLTSGTVKATKRTIEVDGKSVEKMYLEGIASSTVVDRMGDILDDQSQSKMAPQARGLTMWLNHEYTIPEDILGTCITASLRQATDPKQGECVDLYIELEIDDENPRAIKSWRHVQNGTRLAFSIGGIFLDFDWMNEEDWWDWRVIVHDIDLLEISLVGIPANPRAYTKSFDPAGIEEKRLLNMPALDLRAKLTDIAKSFGNAEPLGQRLRDVRETIKKSILGGVTPTFVKESSVNEDQVKPNDGTATPSDTTTETTTENKDVKPDETATDPTAPADGGATSDTTTPIVAEAAPADVKIVSADATDPITAADAVNVPSASKDAPPGDVAATTDPKDEATEQTTTDVAATASTEPQPLSEEETQKLLAGLEQLRLGFRDAGVPNGEASIDALAAMLTGGTLTTRGVSDQNPLNTEQLGKVVGAMKSLATMHAHGLCMESIGNLKGAHANLKDLLPGDYDIPGDANLPNDGDEPTVDRSIAPTQLNALEAEIKSATDVRDAVQAELTTLESKKTELAQSVTDYETKLAELKATSAGRQSANPDGSYENKSGLTVTPDMYQKSSPETNHAIGEAFLGTRASSDARLATK